MCNRGDRGNTGLGRIEDAWIKCLLFGWCLKGSSDWKDVVWVFKHLEKAYDTIYQQGMSQMIRVYGVGGKLLKTVHRF